MGTVIAWVGLLLIPVSCLGTILVGETLLGGGPLTLLLAIAVGIGAPLMGAHWLAERITRPRSS